jgi:hypothetical protein
MAAAGEAHRRLEGAGPGCAQAVDLTKKPEAYAKDAQVAVEGAIADAKSAVHHGVKIQNEVAQVLTNRMAANLNELKALAA